MAALERGGTIVTADPHQAYQIRLAWGQRQARAGLGSWATPDVLPLAAAVARAWHRALIDEADAGHPDPPVLLGVHQERAIWEQIVRSGGNRFLQPHGTARAALRAWRRAREWHIELEESWLSSSDEAATFHDWARLFQERCRARNWIDIASALWRMPVPARPAPWVFAGFDVVPVAVRALAERLRAEGIASELCAGPSVPARAGRVAFADPQGEWNAAARWARAQLETDPQRRLLIVVPDLERVRDRLERTFDEILRPSALLHAPRTDTAPFAIEGGIPLARYPLVAFVLTAVAMVSEPQPFDVVSAWLRSREQRAAQVHAATRARLDCELRRSAAHELDLDGLALALKRAARVLGVDEPLIAALPAFRRSLEGRHGLAHWSALLSAALQELGWPGPGPRDSAEQQTLQKFHETLAELAMLDDVVGPVDARGLRQHLSAIAEQTRFQPETGAAPVTLSGRLADPALALDGLWVCGMHADGWPRAPRPDPFLPWELQVEAGLPEATAAGMLALARRITARWASSATEVIFSRPLRLDDEECLASPLIADMPEIALDGGETHAYWRTVRQSAQREELDDFAAPPLPAAAPIPGGAYAVSLQSLCPIRAFADLRLRAAPLREPGPGIDSRTRGELVHEALSHLWARLKTHDALARVGESECAALAAASARHAVARRLEQAPRWSSQLIALERERLVTLLREWLAVERARPPFEVIAREATVGALVAGHPIQLRIDRVDRVGDGRLLVIDYKTGPQAPAASLGERPENAQLPLYATTYQPTPQGTAIALVRPGDCSLKGESSAPAMTPGLGATDWNVRLAQWRRTVEQLVQGFASGDARVDPRTAATCDSCHLQAFCRIDELRAGPVIDAELADGD